MDDRWFGLGDRCRYPAKGLDESKTSILSAHLVDGRHHRVYRFCCMVPA